MMQSQMIENIEERENTLPPPEEQQREKAAKMNGCGTAETARIGAANISQGKILSFNSRQACLRYFPSCG